MVAGRFLDACAVLSGSMLALLLPGTSAAAWPSDPLVNVPLCTAANQQDYPTIVSDGAGGAIVTWTDFRTTPAIYAQHVLASGGVDPGWPADGRALSTTGGTQGYPTIVSDGSGGAIVTWYDGRSGENDIYAQHVLASGAVDPAWPVKGRALCTAPGDQAFPTIASDGAGGAIVTWYDRRSGDYDIYAQHVLATGVADPGWPADGRALCTAASDQASPTIVSDGAGGAIVTWCDARSGNYDIYAQRVLATGVVDPGWPADGRALCAATSAQFRPTIASDGAGGAIATWYDHRSGNDDIYAQRVLATGVVDPGWPADGRALCAAAGMQYDPEIVSDGASGAIVTWTDPRDTTTAIYAQHVLASGSVDPAWPVDGRAMCTAAIDQESPRIVSDGAGGAIVAWFDHRSGNDDIYAQRVLATGAVDPGWPADGRALCTAANEQFYPSITSDGAGGAIVVWEDERSSNVDIYAQRVDATGHLGGVAPLAVPGEAPVALTLERVRPNPTRGTTLSVQFTLPSAAAASLELLDVAGRRIASRQVGLLGAGQHDLELGADQRLAPGLYLVRLQQGMNVSVARAVVLQ